MRRLLSIAVMLASACVATASCSSSDRVDLALAPAEETPPAFIDPNNADASSADASGPILACVATECPEPFATCVSLERPSFKCGTDLSSDNDNCGVCGNSCIEYLPINMTSRCVDGACRLQCYKHHSGINGYQDWTDCNGLVEDGCEVNVTVDADNCGVCGNKCGEGIPCIEGKCGCPGGLTLCNGKCVDIAFDDANCGRCNNPCELPSDACDPLEPHSTYGCVEGVCGRKKCKSNRYDCNNDLGPDDCEGDGCEVASLKTDQNCGACGVKCTAPEKCVNEGAGYECAIPCARGGKTKCGSQCVDLLNDRNNCGACDNRCRPSAVDDLSINETASCRQGVCVYECMPGFGNCNGNPADGCEIDLRIHPQNCGSCGVACDVAAGQPCIEGKCLMRGCDAGVTN